MPLSLSPAIITGVPVAILKISHFVMDHIKGQTLNLSSLLYQRKARFIFAVASGPQTNRCAMALIRICDKKGVSIYIDTPKAYYLILKGDTSIKYRNPWYQ
jgi:hypothetical protein